YGVKFYPPGTPLSGQNERSTPVVMQNAGEHISVVWPTSIRTQDPVFPLPTRRKRAESGANCDRDTGSCGYSPKTAPARGRAGAVASLEVPEGGERHDSDVGSLSADPIKFFFRPGRVFINCV